MTVLPDSEAWDDDVPASADLVLDGVRVKIRHIIDALESEKDLHSMTVEEWAAYLLMIAPDVYGDRPPPGRPCLAEPGTEAKMQAMEDRDAAGLGLYHFDDLPIDPDDRGAREVTRGRNGREIPGELTDTAARSRERGAA